MDVGNRQCIKNEDMVLFKNEISGNNIKTNFSYNSRKETVKLRKVNSAVNMLRQQSDMTVRLLVLHEDIRWFSQR